MRHCGSTRRSRNRLTVFGDSRGYVMLDQFTSSDIDVFYGGWNLGPRAKGKRLGTLRAFFRFCMNRKWLHENPVSTDIKPPMGANRVANKAPYTDEKLQRIIDACDKHRCVAGRSARCSSWQVRLKNLPHPTVSVIPSRESCCNAACRFPMSPICSATMKKPFVSTIRGGFLNDKHV